MRKRSLQITCGLLASLLFFSCSDEGDQSGSTGTEESDAPIAFTHKMMKSVPGQPMHAQFAYDCASCTFEQWLEIEPPTGWQKGPPQVAVMNRGIMRSTPSFEKVQEIWPSLAEEEFYESWDFLEEVPGNEYELIAVNIGPPVIVQFAPSRVIITRVMRDTTLTFDAGKRVHEVTNDDGDVFVLFAYGVDPQNVVIPDFQDSEVLADFTPPNGWTYSTRVLEADIVLDSEDITSVMAIRSPDGLNSTWEKR